MNCLTIDVEDWFHILDSDVAPVREQWPTMEGRLEQNMGRILDLLASYRVRATFFWLGWVAERHKALIRRCLSEGHEIASHGYAHLLAYRVGRAAFEEDAVQAKHCLEDITGSEVAGYRAPGFGITAATPWAFDSIRTVGYLYDSSVFPASRGHGGLPSARLEPHLIQTRSGELFEIPLPVVSVLGRRTSVFGGGYLRLAPRGVIQWGIAKLKAADRPLVVYLHPRDIDPGQPRLPLPRIRRFKSYVNLDTTFAKIQWLCRTYRFELMRDLVRAYRARRAFGPARAYPSSKIALDRA